MGNWRRVWIVGNIPPEQVRPLCAALAEPTEYAGDWPDYHPLRTGSGLAGLGVWPAPVVNAVGNLYERDFSPEDVRDACENHVLPAAPGASLKIHCGADWEQAECVGTVTVAGGVATLGPPEVVALPEISDEVVHARLFRAIYGATPSSETETTDG